MLWERSGHSSTKILEPPLVYDSVYELPLYNFIKITLGQLPEPDNWQLIQEQWAELSGDKSMSRVFVLIRQITYLKTRLNIIQLIVNQLSLRGNKELVQILKVDLGFKLPFNDLNADLPKVISMAKADVVKLSLAEKEYNDLKKDNPEVTEQDWNDELIELGKYQGWHIDNKIITVGEYLSIKKAYRSYVESLKKGYNPG